ncbi:hypothetical protein ACH4TQ_08490 [Streptomyces sp. NPDC021218]|uniref:hypothetical protein n=1 Tax=unclassified Streptomyces TaxID=2593676 RepID=UPI00367B6FCA
MTMTGVNPMNGAVLTTAMRDFLAHAAIELVTNGQPAPDHAGAFEPATLAQTTAKALIADPLPPWLRNANPDRMPRRVDGVLTDEPIEEGP